MKEAAFQRTVVDIALRFGWSCWHVPAPMRAIRGGGFVGAREGAGLPDLIMIHDDPARLVFAELKGDNGKLSAEQQDFLQAASKVAAEAFGFEDPVSFPRIVGVYVWWPKDIDLIEQILRSRVLI